MLAKKPQKRFFRSQAYVQALQAELNELRQQLSKAKDASNVQNQCV